MPKLKDEKPEPESFLIEVPIAEVPPATWGLHVNTHLSPKQSLALRRVTAGSTNDWPGCQTGGGSSMPAMR